MSEKSLVKEAMSAPYASSGVVIGLIRQQRDKGLPDVLNRHKLLSLGVSEFTTPRVAQTLRFLGLIDQSGQQTLLFNQIKRVKDNEYPELLAQILRNAYAGVFDLVNVSTAQESTIQNAFRNYEPSAQRARMINLFLGLCREAMLFEDAPISSNNRQKREKIITNPKRNRTVPSSHDANKPIHTVGSNLHSNPWTINEPTLQVDISPRYQLLYVLLQQLPSDGKWTQRKRDQWIGAVSANIDLLIDV